MNTYPYKRTRDGVSSARMSGFSLVEMMVSITIGLMIIASLVGVLTSNVRNSKANDRGAELQGNGRYALDHLKREIRLAGDRGYTWAEPTPASGVLAVTGECGGSGSGFVENIRQGIWGSNDSNPYSADCMNGTYLRGDVLVLRRVATAPATDCTTNPTGASTLYFRSAYGVGMVYKGTTPPATVTGTPCGDYALVEYVYYIGRDNADATIPALRRVALFSDGTMSDEMVVSGIEHMQVSYGRATTDGNTRYYNANGIAGTSTDTAKTEWDDVNSIRIWLLARSARAEQGYRNTSTYAMGDLPNYAVDDGFRRQLFMTAVQLRN